MDFDFGEKEEAVRREIREFVRQELPPGWLMGRLEEESRDEDWEFAMSISRKLSKRGWLTMSWPKEYGGKGATLWEQMVYREEAGYWAIPGVTCFWHDVLCIMSEDVTPPSWLILAHAPDLPAIGSASGEAGGPKPSRRLRFNYYHGSL